jgi:hypothetical protein
VNYPEQEGAPVPDLDAVQQQTPIDPLVTCVEGTVRTQALPARIAILHNVNVSTTAVRLVGGDPRRARALVWPSMAPADSVSAYGTEDVTVTSVAGDVVAEIPAASLPPGRYRIDAYAYMKSATTPVVLDALQISVGGVAVMRLMSYNAVQSSSAANVRAPVTIEATVTGSQTIAVTVATPETGTNVETFNAVITATAIGAGAVYVGTREDEVQQETAARLTGSEPLVMNHCEELWAKAESGAVNVSYLLEQWAD